MDFITGLPRTVRQHDSIMVVVVRLHGVPKKFLLDRDAKFTSKFWKDLFSRLGTELAFIIAYHLQTYGKTERDNRILEDTLRMYVMHKQWKWDQYLPLVEFS